MKLYLPFIIGVIIALNSPVFAQTDEQASGFNDNEYITLTTDVLIDRALEGVVPDYQKGFPRRNINPDAIEEIKLRKDKGDKTAYNKVIELAESGNLSAQLLMVILTGMTVDNLPQAYKESYKWWAMAAEQGDIDSQALVAGAYMEGTYLEQNYNKSFDFALAAAKRGDNLAALLVAKFYREGLGHIEKNPIEAFAWINMKAFGLNNSGLFITDKLSDEDYEKAVALSKEYYRLYCEPYWSEESKISLQKKLDEAQTKRDLEK